MAAGAAGLTVACATRSVPPSAGDPVPAPAASERSSRFSHLRGFCDGISAPDAAEYAERQERCREALRAAGVDAVAVEAGVSLDYLTGVRWRQSERPLLYVLPVKGSPFWVGPHFEEGTLRESGVENDELRLWHEHESPYARTRQGLADAGLSAGRLALEPSMRSFVAAGLRSSGIEVVVEHDVVSECRMRKSASELARLRRANEATKAALAAAAKHVQEGMSEADLGSLIREAQTEAGLESIWTLVAFGDAAAYPHGTREKHPLRKGELILVDTGGKLHGYSSDITRTWPFGPVSAEQRKAWETVLAAQTRALDGYRAGLAPEKADALARGVVDGAGYGDAYQAFSHRLGHGIGMEVHEHPYVVRGNARAFKPGNTMSNEPGIYLRGKLGVRIEDIVAIRDDGPEVFGPRAVSLEDPFGEG